MHEWDVEATGTLHWMGKVWADTEHEAQQVARALARQFGDSCDWDVQAKQAVEPEQSV